MLKKLYSVCHLDKKSGLEIRVVQENHVNKMTRFDAILYKIFLSNFFKITESRHHDLASSFSLVEL